MTRHHASSEALAHRIEIAETAIEAGAMEHWLATHPDSDGRLIRRGHASVIHGATPDSITRLWGFALGVEPEVDLLDDAIAEARGRDHTKITFEWNPYMHPGLFDCLAERRFVVQEFTHTYVLDSSRVSAPSRPLAEGLRIELLDPANENVLEAAVRAWSTGIGSPEVPGHLRIVGRIQMTFPGRTVYMATHEGTPVAIGTMAIHEGLAFLGTAATMPDYRSRGIQSHLLHRRIVRALDEGCDLVTIGSDPGTISQRNIERAGFRGIYTKLTTKLGLNLDAT